MCLTQAEGPAKAEVKDLTLITEHLMQVLLGLN